jgi:large repetitive protein
VTYFLEYAPVLENPTVWTSIEMISSMITVVEIGDCIESVTIHDLESLTGLTGGKGFVRIRAELDSNTDHISHTEVEGWKETPFELCCRTYNSPFLRQSAFTGTVGNVTGQSVDFADAGLDLAAILASGGNWIIEVTSGDNEGHRFDVVSSAANSLTLATDSNLFENAAPYNTLTGAVPASLADDTIALRRHWTMDEIFPPSAFGATADRTTADQVQLMASGQWITYWLYDDGVLPARWVKTGDNTYTDQGTTVLAPGQGMFFNNRGGLTSILAYGEVRENDFIRPISIGSNLIAGGYPVDQSAAAANGRAMTVTNEFFGSRDIATADSIFIWNSDNVIGETGYTTYFLNNNAPRIPSVIKWAKVGDASLLSRDAETLLLGNRSVLFRSKNGLADYKNPNPWAP